MHLCTFAPCSLCGVSGVGDLSNLPLALDNASLSGRGWRCRYCNGMFFFTPLVTALSLFLARRRNPLAKGPFTYTFDSDGIHVSGDTFEMKLKWPAIRKVRESGSFIFFFTAPARAQCIPLAQVRATGQLDDLRALVARYVENVPARAG